MGELSPTPRLVRPRALLLDFGGVVVSTTSRPTWPDELAAEICDRLGRHLAAGRADPHRHPVRRDRRLVLEERDVAPGRAPRADPPRVLGRLRRRGLAGPGAGLGHRRGTALCKRMGELRSVRTDRPGIEELFDAAETFGVPVGIVSNALSGAVHRDHMERHGLDKRVALQLYSDEVGIRKPHPGMITMAAAALGAPVGSTWYVGDNFDRDVLCGRRARVGAAVLMEDTGTYDRPFPVPVEPDAVVADPHGLRALLEAACTPSEGER